MTETQLRDVLEIGEEAATAKATAEAKWRERRLLVIRKALDDVRNGAITWEAARLTIEEVMP